MLLGHYSNSLYEEAIITYKSVLHCNLAISCARLNRPVYKYFISAKKRVSCV